MALPHEATPVILPVVPLSVVQLQDQPGKSSEASPPSLSCASGKLEAHFPMTLGTPERLSM